MTRLTLVIFALFLILTLGQISHANDCNEECLTPSDCTATSCPVCLGSCIACAELGNHGACTDSMTGADVNCVWTGSRCKSVLEIPEMPARLWTLLFIPLALLGYALTYRRLA